MTIFGDDPPGAWKGIERVAIDLTPVRPGGENGGAKLLALELVRTLAGQRQATHFTVITSPDTHDELSLLDAGNVSRYCIADPPPQPPNGAARGAVRIRAERTAANLLPQWAKTRLVRWTQSPQPPAPSSPLIQALGAQLLFCPFTAPFYQHPSVPTVSLVHDLQFLTYPLFFQEDDLRQRDRHFRWACEVAQRIVCPSEYVRSKVIEHGGVSPERVTAVHNTVHSRFDTLSDHEIVRQIASCGLQPGGYLIYPANFWRHKNHDMLLTAFSMFVHRNPSATMQLVLTGAPCKRRDEVETAVKAFGLDHRVVLPGFVDETRFAALLQGSFALIFPSLYEGFGMPVLEAMSAGKPVLCSSCTSLPEVAGDAALYFDPRSPFAISEAIESLVSDTKLTSKLSRDGVNRASQFGTVETMAQAYWSAMESAVDAATPAMSGV